MLDAYNSPASHMIIGAAIEVHRTLGPGFLEAVYQEALAIEFRRRGVQFRREVLLELEYKGERLQATYKADFVAEGLVLELKAKRELSEADDCQVLNYLRASRTPLGLLLNFSEERLVVRRFVNGLDEPVSADSATSAFQLPSA